MLIRDSDWKTIHEQFSEDQKAALRASVQGQAICPKGFIIDETKLDVVLEFKITQAMAVVDHMNAIYLQSPRADRKR